jgi:hypothetical protein
MLNLPRGKATQNKNHNFSLKITAHENRFCLKYEYCKNIHPLF